MPFESVPSTVALAAGTGVVGAVSTGAVVVLSAITGGVTGTVAGGGGTIAWVSAYRAMLRLIRSSAVACPVLRSATGTVCMRVCTRSRPGGIGLDSPEPVVLFVLADSRAQDGKAVLGPIFMGYS